MGFFEENPIVFIVAVILIVEAWALLKQGLARLFGKYRSRRSP